MELPVDFRSMSALCCPTMQHLTGAALTAVAALALAAAWAGTPEWERGHVSEAASCR